MLTQVHPVALFKEYQLVPFWKPTSGKTLIHLFLVCLRSAPITNWELVIGSVIG